MYIHINLLAGFPGWGPNAGFGGMNSGFGGSGGRGETYACTTCTVRYANAITSKVLMDEAHMCDRMHVSKISKLVDRSRSACFDVLIKYFFSDLSVKT